MTTDRIGLHSVPLPLLIIIGTSFFFLRLCGYIVSTAPEVFVCHVFQCSPNAAALTKALAEACQVRRFFKNMFEACDPLMYDSLILE